MSGALGDGGPKDYCKAAETNPGSAGGNENVIDTVGILINSPFSWTENGAADSVDSPNGGNALSFAVDDELSTFFGGQSQLIAVTTTGSRKSF